MPYIGSRRRPPDGNGSGDDDLLGDVGWDDESGGRGREIELTAEPRTRPAPEAWPAREPWEHDEEPPAAPRLPLGQDDFQRRRATAVLILFALLAVAIGIPVAVFGGGGDSEPAPTTAPVTTTAPPATGTAPSGGGETQSGGSTGGETGESGGGAATPALELPESGLLQPGDEGPAVKQLQEALAALGFDPGAADGDYGNATETAVTAFQQANGLEADGVVGEATAQALNDALARG